MKQTILVFCLLFSGTTFLGGTADAQFTKNAICPVMANEPTKEKYYVDYRGERIYLCCQNCVKAFKKNPEKYWAKVQNMAASNSREET